MKINLTPAELIDQLRAWFFPKDRSIYMADGCSVYLPGPYQLALARIAETTLAAPAGFVTFSNIPQTFRHLLMVCQLRSDAVAESDTVRLRFNGNSAANYDQQRLTVNNATVSGAALRAQTGINIALCEAANSRANNFAGFEIFIPGYASATAEKWAFCPISGAFGNVSADGDLYTTAGYGRWRSTAAITSLTLGQVTGPNFVAGSVVALYGIM